MKLLKNKKGITLVELLAVLVILGIIAAIAVPTVGSLISNARANAAAETGNGYVQAARLWNLEDNISIITLSAIEDTNRVSTSAESFDPASDGLFFIISNGVVTNLVTDPANITGSSLSTLEINGETVNFSDGVFTRP